MLLAKNRRPELLRWLVLLGVGTWLLHPFASGQLIGTGDALWYANMLADFVTQLRAGVFPVFVGQTDFAFNGAVYPLRVAPLYQHLAGAIDFLTGRRLGFLELQHATVLVCGYAGLFCSYATLRHLAPTRPWTSTACAILYVACPGVLGTIYTQDLYMTWMTVPILPAVMYGIARSFVRDDLQAQLWLAASLAALWYAHAPIALWSTLIAVFCQVVRLIRAHHRPAACKRSAVGALAFVTLAHYPFISVASLQIPEAPSTVTAPLQGQGQILEVIRDVFPDVLFPLSPSARKLSDLQLGYAGWGAFLLVGLAACRGHGDHTLRSLAACILVLLLLLLPVPGITGWMWAQIPELIKRITYYWPMHRFYLLLAAMLAIGTQVALDGLGIRWQRIILVALAIGCCWSLWEARQFVRAGHERTASVARSEQGLRPENRVLSKHAYGLFAETPPYFSHGAMDARSESRLLDGRSLELRPEPSPSAPWQQFRGRIDVNPGVLLLEPKLRLEPGKRYELLFDFGSRTYTGILQLSGSTLFREYILPESGGPLAFGSQSGNSSRLSLWTSAATMDEISVRFIPTATGADPSDFRDFARFSLHEHPARPEIETLSLLPYRAKVSPIGTAWLETPRMYLPGYAATVNDRTVEVRRSPQGLAMIPLAAEPQEVELYFVGPLFLRASYWLALAGWLILGGFAGMRFITRRAPIDTTEVL